MNTGQDTNINSAVDTVFVPLYLNRNTLLTDTSYEENIGAKDYILTTLQDSIPLSKKAQSMFVEKAPVVHKNLALSKKEQSISSLWIFGILLFIGVVSALLMRFARSNMRDFLSGCFSKNQIALSTKDGERVNNLILVPIIFVFLPVVSLLIFSLLNYFDYSFTLYNYTLSSYTLYFGIYLASLVVYFIKIILIRFFGWLFKSQKLSNYYIQIQYNFNFLMGILLFLPVFCLEYIDIYYKEIFIFISVFILVTLIITRLVRNFYVIISSLKFSHFYLFFYLCTLELLPLILISKFLFF